MPITAPVPDIHKAKLAFLNHVESCDKASMSDEAVMALVKITDAFNAEPFEVEELWETICDYAMDHVEDIEDMPEWFESLYHDIGYAKEDSITQPARGIQ